MIDLLNKFLEETRVTVPGFISACVVDASGSIVVKGVSDPNVNVELEASFQLEIIKQAHRSLQVSSLNKNNKMGLISIETEKYTYFLDSSDEGAMFFVLMLDAEKANMAITRTFIAKSRKVLMEKLKL